MAKFEKKNAEKLGWSFVHEQPAETVDLGDGITRATPASYVAEKPITNGMLHEQAESFDVLLQRIEAYEEQLRVKGIEPASPELPERPAAPDKPEEGVVDQFAEPLHEHTVIRPDGSVIPDSVWSDRDRQEAIFDGEKMVFRGPASL